MTKVSRYTFFCTGLIVLMVAMMLALSMTAHVAYAQGLYGDQSVPANGFVPLAQTPSGQLSQLYNSNGDLSTFINSLFRFALSIGALAAVLRLAYAGYLYMGQADMWSHKGEAKKIIGDVTLGLLLLLGIWLILNQINPDIVKFNALRNFTRVQQTNTPGAAPVQPGASAAPSGSVNVDQFNNGMPSP